MSADAGADAVKFQNYRTEDFVSDRSLVYEYQAGGQRISETQWDMFKRRELPKGALAELQHHCEDRGVALISTPTSAEGVDDLVAVHAAAVKNGSDYLVHLPLVAAMARSGLPTVLRSGCRRSPRRTRPFALSAAPEGATSSCSTAPRATQPTPTTSICAASR